jgi:hypothetical protein
MNKKDRQFKCSCGSTEFKREVIVGDVLIYDGEILVDKNGQPSTFLEEGIPKVYEGETVEGSARTFCAECKKEYRDVG